jgi:hypothetical protein
MNPREDPLPKRLARPPRIAHDSLEAVREIYAEAVAQGLNRKSEPLPRLAQR